MNLPDRPRPRLTLTRSGWNRLGRRASAAVWRTLHPTSRGPFVEAGPPAPASRLYYETADGWRAPLFRIDARPESAGEPVLVAHGISSGPDLYRYGAASLVEALRAAGFAPYLWTHRGDRHAVPPPGAALAGQVAEAIVEQDLPAALRAVAEHSGFARVHLIGHGLGGLLVMAGAGRREATIASVVALGAPLSMPGSGTTGQDALAALLALVPGGWPVPLRALGRIGAPLVGAGRAMFDLARRSPGARLRGALLYGAEDPSVALVRAVRGWVASGAPSLYGGAVDLCDGIASAEVPLLVVTGTEDPICPPDAGERALERWGHADKAAIRVPGSHLDLVLGADVGAEVFAPLVAWLSERRKRAWAWEGTGA